MERDFNFFHRTLKINRRQAFTGQWIPLVLLIAIVLIIIPVDVADARGTTSSCQTVCICKWKGGKQTVECIGQALITIPDNVDPNTQVLDMSGNNLQILPRDTFIRASLLNLQKVYLRNCRLGQIDDEAFKGLTNLVELDLSHNLLTQIPSATLMHIPSLRELTIASNPIQKLESHAFRMTHSLTKLDISHCDIQTISPEAFNGLTSLHSLKLNGNKLSELRPRTIETLSKLHGVELHDNPWMCDCRLRAAKIWLTQNNIPYPVAPICSGGPERVMDRTFAELNIDDFACRPEIMPVSRFIEATTGENATIVCRTSAVPSANVNWYWNGRLLVNSSAFSSYQKVYIFEDGEFEKRSRLVLTNAQETDSSEFYCVADNRAGSAEANFTLHVAMRTAGMASLGSGQIVGLSAALVILILFILLIILFLLVRLRRLPFTESKTPNHLEVITTVSPQSNINGKTCSNQVANDCNSIDRKTPNDLKLTNPVQKPPRLTDINYSTSHYDGNGSVISSNGPLFVSPTASAGNNPDLINDTKRLGSGELAALGIETLLASSSNGVTDTIPRSGSGEYSRAGCDSLYPSGLWEQNAASGTATTSLGASSTVQTDPVGQFGTTAQQQQELYLKRAASSTIPTFSYNDKTPIISSAHILNLDDEHSSAEFMSRTFPRSAVAHQMIVTTSSPSSNNGVSGFVTSGTVGGYPSDYGLPIVAGAEQHRSRDVLPPAGMPTNAKTLRVWQRGGVPVLPPVTALKRALSSSSRNSPDEGYQEGCGTDV